MNIGFPSVELLWFPNIDFPASDAAEITPLPPVVITGGTLNRLRRRRKREQQEAEDEEVLCLILFTRP